MRASLIAQLVKNLCAMQETWFNSWVGKICWRRDRLPTPVFFSFPCGSAGKESTCNAGDLGFIPVLGRSPGEGKGYPFQYFGLENAMDYTVHGILQARIPEQVALSFSRGSFQSKNRTGVSCIAGGFFTNWAIREVHSWLHILVLTLINYISIRCFF